MQRKWAGLFTGWLCGAALCSGCSPTEPIATQQAAVIGASGDHAITGQEVVNQYTVLAANAAAGGKTLTVQSLSALPGLQAGDVLFIIQMQGADIDRLSDSPRYGEVMDIRTAGHYEFLTVTGVDAATATVQVSSTGGKGLKLDYAAAGRTQVIVVPQYRNLTVAAGATLSATPWNGSIGGVVVVTADTVQVDGTISASGLGFRGGQLQNGGSVNFPGFRLPSSAIGGERGEGVGGSQLDYDALNGRYGRGAAGNGGGGGNSQNCAGGGGANALAAGKVWNGQGVMDVSTADLKLAWALDPAYAALGNMFADSAGGGRGGYGCSAAALDPTVNAPLAAGWGCGSRAPYGGFGGRPLTNDVRQRLYFGGGGGAGHGDSGNSGAGGNGGGLVFVLARNIKGQGRITADGAPGGVAGAGGSAALDGPGGAGGGGAVVLMASESISAVQLSAAGGAGGNHRNPSSAEGEGGGGGGGGGFAATVGQSSAQLAVTGGKSGTTNVPGFAKMPTNGGTDGASGEQTQVASFSPDFLPPIQAVDMEITLGFGSSKRPGYTVAPIFATVTNLGPDPAVNVQTTITLPPGIPGMAARSKDYACSQQDQTISCTLPTLDAGISASVEVLLDLPREPQGPFTVSSTVTGGGFDYVGGNNQAQLSAEILGFAALSGHGFSCTMSDRTERSSALGWLVLSASLLMFFARRRTASILAMLVGLLCTQACSPSPVPVRLAVTVMGQGSISSNDGTIDCGAQCTREALPGTTTRLIATPASRQRFVSWEGRCTGTVPTCDLTLLDDSQAVATFAAIPDSCFDGVMNTTETDVDCGGSCAPCETGKSCRVVGDCQNAQCISGLCSTCTLGTNLIINGDAEIPGNAQYLLGWSSNSLETVGYDTGFLASTAPGPTSRGKYHFAGGVTSMGQATQGIDIRSCAALIDKGLLTYQLVGWLGGYSAQNDNARVKVDFQDNQMGARSSTTIGPVLSADRGGVDSLLMRTDAGDVPAASRYIGVTVTVTRTDGAYCDGYADNLSLVLNLKP